MPPTDEILQAVTDTVDRATLETSPLRRAVMLARTRATLAQWRRGALTSQAAADLIRRGVRDGAH